MIVQPSPLFTVVFSASVLLPGVGSVSVASTVEVAVMVPVAAGVTVIVTVAEPDAAMDPSEQFTFGALMLQEPWLGVAETMPAEAPDRVVSAVTPVAPEGPALATLRV
ncbi:MAG TPA: hypothetical protein VLJ59_03295 [Mycobacteriales bacterium]|nr:hypothetical protein [Mycobacteriales bacterium]